MAGKEEIEYLEEEEGEMDIEEGEDSEGSEEEFDPDEDEHEQKVLKKIEEQEEIEGAEFISEEEDEEGQEFEPPSDDFLSDSSDDSGSETDGFVREVEYKPSKHQGLIKKVVKYYAMPFVAPKPSELPVPAEITPGEPKQITQ
jgi:hypothetical protein